MAQMQFTPAQQAAISHKGGDLLVAAAAGSGKTRVLVSRLLDAVSQGRNINEFLIITYTRAAAAELKSRILEELNALEGRSPSAHLRRQTALLYQADIGTIHAIFGKFLREFAHKLDLNPDFRQADEEQTRHIKAAVLEDILEERYRDLNEFAGFRDLLNHLSVGRKDDILSETVLRLHEKANSHPCPKSWADTCIKHLSTEGKSDFKETPWGAYLLEQAHKEASAFYAEMSEVRRTFDPIIEAAHASSWEETLAHLAQFIKATEVGWDATYAARFISFPRPKNLKAGTYEREKDLRNRIKAAMKKWDEIFAETTKEAFLDLTQSTAAISALFALCFDFDKAYTAEKTRLGILDFSDLEQLSIRLLLDPDTSAPTMEAAEIAARYHEIMVDEFQDVSALQDALFGALSEMGATRFMVGDVKQSIYRFRLADPSIFLKYYERFPELADEDEPSDCAPQKVLLANNFRSHPGILDATNFLFSKLMSKSFGEMDYGAKEALYPGKSVEEHNKKETVVQLDILDFEDLEKDETDRHEMASARHTASEILRLHKEEGFDFGDFAILLRAQSKRSLFEKALEEKDIPVQKGETQHFFYAEDIATVVSLLRIILNPEDDVSLISVLKSPLFVFSPDDLADIRLAVPETSFYGALKIHAHTNEKSALFLEKLSLWRQMHPDMLVHEFLPYLLSQTHASSIFGAKHKKNRLQAFVKMAEDSKRPSLFDFCIYLEKCIAENKSPAIGDGFATNAVQIMSIHKSKGLEFPVVILPNLEKRFNNDDLKKPVLMHTSLGLGLKLQDRARGIRYDTAARLAIARKLQVESRAEELRVLYVAMTRAEKRLIMSVSLEKAESALEKLAYKLSPKLTPQTLAACPNMGQWILLCAMMREDATAIRFGDNIPLIATNYPWNIRHIACKAMPDTKHVEHLHTVATSYPSIAPSDAFLEAMQYKYPYALSADTPSKLTATQVKGRTLDEEVLAEAISSHTQKPAAIFKKPAFVEQNLPLSSAQKGVLTHLVMQFIDFSKAQDLAGVSAEIARLIREEKVPAETKSAVSASLIADFFASSLGKSLATAQNLRREFKFSILAPAHEIGFADTDSEILLQGVVDVFWETPEGIWVLDFKTDYVPAGKSEEKAALYKGQLQTYAYALSKITGKPVREVILYFFTAGKAVHLEL